VFVEDIVSRPSSKYKVTGLDRSNKELGDECSRVKEREG
jgi:hypothetical protein